MSSETKINKDFKEAFNLGYELARELKLKSPILKDLDSSNNRINAMQAGMAQYSNEIAHGQHKKIVPFLGSDGKKDALHNQNSKEDRNKDKGKGMDHLSL